MQKTKTLVGLSKRRQNYDNNSNIFGWNIKVLFHNLMIQ